MTEPLEALIPKTQELLQPLIAKPKLAEKLLQKPPFRFLHDIFTALINGPNGFGKGLYNDFEMDSANIKEKNQKTQYLDKMIMFVGTCAGKEVDVRSSKIVAGLEPENTNLLLIELAKVATNGSVDWHKAVQKTLVAFPSENLPTPATTPSEAKSSPSTSEPPPERPPSKESSGPSEAEKAAEKAAAEAKARDRARREKEENDRREKEMRAEAQRKENEEMRARNEAKQEAAAAAAAAQAQAIPVSARPSSHTNESKQPSASDSPTPVVATAYDKATIAQMISEVNGADFDKTKDWVEKLITKPKMATKLLSKPPFRFLHDSISEIIRVTGFAEGLYNAEEMDSANIKEKQPKMDYLAKIITCVSIQLQVEVEAKPAKIVAGLEPEETNKFLQLLAIACRSGSSRGAVNRTLAKLAEGGGGSAVEVAEAKQNTGSSSSSSKAPPAAEPAAPEAKSSARAPPVAEAKAPPSQESVDMPVKGFETKGEPFAAQQDVEPPQQKAGEEDPAAAAGGNMMQMAPGTSSRTASRAGATTARKRPPKRKENVTEAGRFLVNEAKTTAPTLGIMVDGDNKDDDDEDNNRNDSSGLDGGSSSSASTHLTLGDDKGGAHGKLVRDILNEEKKQQQESTNDDDSGPTLPSEAEGIRFGKRSKSHKSSSKGSASTEGEMKDLRDSIQKLCQAANPIGKCIEFVHEDLEAMQREFDKWKKEYESKVDVFEEEKKKTEESLQPLQVQLLEVEEQIKEQVHKINTIKVTIARNEEKTQKLLRMVVSA